MTNIRNVDRTNNSEKYGKNLDAKVNFLQENLNVLSIEKELISPNYQNILDKLQNPTQEWQNNYQETISVGNYHVNEIWYHSRKDPYRECSRAAAPFRQIIPEPVSPSIKYVINRSPLLILTKCTFSYSISPAFLSKSVSTVKLPS